MDFKSIYQDIIDSRHNYLSKQVVSGHNGPYYDVETKARIYAHKIFELSYFYKETNNKCYLDLINKYASELISNDYRPMNAAFYCRKNPNKDFSNGLIGQAWVIEALAESSRVTKDEKYIKVAKEVFKLHPFDFEKGLWKIVNVDGSYTSYDYTFNHQLWFAAAGVQLLSVSSDTHIKSMCKQFFNKINEHLTIYRNGLIKHSIYNKEGFKGYIKGLLELKSQISKSLKGKTPKYKENGYHLFNVFAFALIKKYGYDLELFNTHKFRKIINYSFNQKLYHWLTKEPLSKDVNNINNIKFDEKNIYGFPYNAPGLEIPLIYSEFAYLINNKENFVKNIMNDQIQLTYDVEKVGFYKNTEDPETLNARFYEFIRSLD